MIKIDKQKVKNNKAALAFLLVEFVMAILVVYLIYKAIGFSVDFEARTLSIAPAADPTIIFSLLLSIIVLVATYIAAKKRAPQLLQAQKAAPSTIGNKTKEKLSKVRSEPRAAALLLIQFIFVFAVAITIVAWLDPEIELIPWSEIGIVAPITTILNAAIAVIAFAFFYYLYSFTAWYRKG